MIKLVAVMDKNGILAAKDFNQNLMFLEKILPELNHFAKIVAKGDVLIGTTAFWEAILELGGYEDMQHKQVYIMSNQSKSSFQALHSEIELTNNFHIIQDLEPIIKKYQGQNKSDLYVWGGVNTFRKTFKIVDQVIIIRTNQIRKTGMKIENLLNNFDLSNVIPVENFAVEIYELKQSEGIPNF